MIIIGLIVGAMTDGLSTPDLKDLSIYPMTCFRDAEESIDGH